MFLENQEYIFKTFEDNNIYDNERYFVNKIIIYFTFVFINNADTLK